MNWVIIEDLRISVDKTTIGHGILREILEVRELITAVGQNIGIDQNVIADIDIDTLVKTAIQVKLGRLSRVPQTHMIVEGIWPPELVPLFMKDGQFPLFVDSEDDLRDLKQPPPPKKFSVRFEDEDEYSDDQEDQRKHQEEDECPTESEMVTNSRISSCKEEDF
ncbi:unnamed protein product [Caenorhabditis angaria]|uniref:Uncharacterized protein n=1 Tax=Caenorhabditis angaria TaxID=860376 RepID=A0A9P1I864_9PELO|nr:unnamed protein product [Caenorhabditis angaria]